MSCVAALLGAVLLDRETWCHHSHLGCSKDHGRVPASQTRSARFYEFIPSISLPIRSSDNKRLQSDRSQTGTSYTQTYIQLNFVAFWAELGSGFAGAVRGRDGPAPTIPARIGAPLNGSSPVPSCPVRDGVSERFTSVCVQDVSRSGNWWEMAKSFFHVFLPFVEYSAHGGQVRGQASCVGRSQRVRCTHGFFWFFWFFFGYPDVVAHIMYGCSVIPGFDEHELRLPS